MIIDTPKPPASVTEIKASSARLLDLLVGWAEYVEQTEDEFEDSLKSQDLFGLHQEAGGLMLLDGDTERQAVEAFLKNRVLPLILREE